MNYTGHIPIPYNMVEAELHLDPAVRRANGTNTELLQFLIERGSEEVTERVMRAAVILFAAKRGTWTQCFETALIWELG